MNATGLLLLDPLEEIMSDQFHEQFSSALMAFYNRPLVPGGVTTRGISPEGAVFIAAKLNGLELPRTLDKLVLIGENVTLMKDEDCLLYTSSFENAWRFQPERAFRERRIKGLVRSRLKYCLLYTSRCV